MKKWNNINNKAIHFWFRTAILFLVFKDGIKLF